MSCTLGTTTTGYACSDDIHSLLVASHVSSVTMFHFFDFLDPFSKALVRKCQLDRSGALYPYVRVVYVAMKFHNTMLLGIFVTFFWGIMVETTYPAKFREKTSRSAKCSNVCDKRQTSMIMQRNLSWQIRLFNKA
jgi:hypothetical protein